MIMFQQGCFGQRGPRFISLKLAKLSKIINVYLKKKVFALIKLLFFYFKYLLIEIIQRIKIIEKIFRFTKFKFQASLFDSSL